LKINENIEAWVSAINKNWKKIITLFLRVYGFMGGMLTVSPCFATNLTLEPMSMFRLPEVIMKVCKSIVMIKIS